MKHENMKSNIVNKREKLSARRWFFVRFYLWKEVDQQDRICSFRNSSRNIIKHCSEDLTSFQRQLNELGKEVGKYKPDSKMKLETKIGLVQITI